MGALVVEVFTEPWWWWKWWWVVWYQLVGGLANPKFGQ